MTGTPFDPANDRIGVYSAALQQIAEVTGRVLVARALALMHGPNSPIFVFYGTPSPIPSGVETVMSGWSQSDSVNVSGTLSPSAGTFVAAAPDAGWWLFFASGNTNGSTTAEQSAVYVNGVRVAFSSGDASTPTLNLDQSCISRPVKIAAGDVVSSTYEQVSGINMPMGNNLSNHFCGVRITSDLANLWS